MKNFIIILFFITIYTKPLNLITMDLELKEDNFYRIKNIDTHLNFSSNNQTRISLMPKNYITLIKMILKNNHILYNCNTHIRRMEDKNYETFFCEKNTGYKDMNKIKLNFNLEKYNISVNNSNLFSKEGKYYYFNFWTNNDITDVVISEILLEERLNHKNIYIRKSEGDEDNINDKNDTYKNDTNNNQNYKNNHTAGIGWLGICFIIILTIIVIYVLYVLFRYYRRKKYQNPSFYYKITEEMFDDITPIE